MILLVAEINNLKTNPHRPARGIVIEAKLDKGRGPVAVSYTHLDVYKRQMQHC